MIQDSVKDIFFNSVMKSLIDEVMDKKGQEIQYINRLFNLKSSH